MKSYGEIKRYEAHQTAQIAKELIDRQMIKFGWRTIAFPLFIYDYIRYIKRLSVLRKNLFFTGAFMGTCRSIFSCRGPGRASR